MLLPPLDTFFEEKIFCSHYFFATTHSMASFTAEHCDKVLHLSSRPPSRHHSDMRAAGVPTNSIRAAFDVPRFGLSCKEKKKKEEEKNHESVCSICAETVPLINFVAVSCCDQQLCQSCVNQIIETKATQASEILSMYLSSSNRVHQCPQCHTGPLEHFACSDLTGSLHNRCPKCEFSSESIKSWPEWNGELCESLRAYDDSDGKQIDCPFCRQLCMLEEIQSICNFQPKRKSSSSPLSNWCVTCSQHKDRHTLNVKGKHKCF